MNNQGLYLVDNEDEEEVLNQLILNDPMSQKQMNHAVEEGTYSNGRKDRVVDQNDRKNS